LPEYPQKTLLSREQGVGFCIPEQLPRPLISKRFKESRADPPRERPASKTYNLIYDPPLFPAGSEHDCLGLCFLQYWWDDWDAVHLGYAYIEQHDIRLKVVDDIDCLETIDSLADVLTFLLLEEDQADPCPKKPVIVSDHNPDLDLHRISAPILWIS
jgi:hypothetical protein